jgi:hypothetical protein
LDNTFDETKVTVLAVGQVIAPAAGQEAWWPEGLVHRVSAERASICYILHLGEDGRLVANRLYNQTTKVGDLIIVDSPLPILKKLAAAVLANRWKEDQPEVLIDSAKEVLARRIKEEEG